MITVDVNGKSIMTKEIDEVTGILRLFTSPNRGMKPADGIIRAVTIITSEKYGGNLSKKTNIYKDELFEKDLVRLLCRPLELFLIETEQFISR